MMANGIKIAEYKFNNTMSDLIPVFNAEFTDYTYEDTIDGDIKTRVIYSDELPTSIGFSGCTQLIECGYLALDEVSSMSGAFTRCSSLTKIDSTEWNFSNIQSIDTAFYGCGALSEIVGIEDWNVRSLGLNNSSRATVGVFAECRSLTKLDLSRWVIVHPTNGNSMFTGCINLTEVHMPRFDNIVNILAMFKGCTSLVEVHGFENVRQLDSGSNRRTFEDCTSLKYIDMSEMDASNITRLDSAFLNCSSLVEIDLSHALFSSSVILSPLFSSCEQLKLVHINGKNSETFINNVISLLPTKTSDSMGTLNIVDLVDISKIDVATANSKNWNIVNYNTRVARYKFDNTSYNLMPEFDSSFDDYIYNDIVIGDITTRGIYSTKLPTVVKFSNNNEINNLLEVLHVETDIIDLSHMFYNCVNVTKLNLSNLDTRNATNMDSMLEGCTSLESLILNNWDIINIVNISDAFNQCNNLNLIEMKNSDKDSINKIISAIPSGTDQCILNIMNTKVVSGINYDEAEEKYWKVYYRDKDRPLQRFKSGNRMKSVSGGSDIISN